MTYSKRNTPDRYPLVLRQRLGQIKLHYGVTIATKFGCFAGIQIEKYRIRVKTILDDYNNSDAGDTGLSGFHNHCCVSPSQSMILFDAIKLNDSDLLNQSH